MSVRAVRLVRSLCRVAVLPGVLLAGITQVALFPTATTARIACIAPSALVVTLEGRLVALFARHKGAPIETRVLFFWLFLGTTAENREQQDQQQDPTSCSVCHGPTDHSGMRRSYATVIALFTVFRATRQAS